MINGSEHNSSLWMHKNSIKKVNWSNCTELLTWSSENQYRYLEKSSETDNYQIT